MGTLGVRNNTVDLPTVHALDILGSATLSVDTVRGNITLLAGEAELEKDLFLLGDLVENDQASFVGTYSKINKLLTLLPKKETVTGLGLTLQLSNTRTVTILTSLSFLPATRRGKNSVARVYNFSDPLSVEKTYFSTRPSQVASMSNPQLYYYHINKATWEQVYQSTLTADKKGIEGLNSNKVSGLTVFDGDALYYPHFFSPNGDGINDKYEIENSFTYANSRLVIMTTTGKIVFEESPYRNDFAATNISGGTYYFVFYTDKDEPTSAHKWTVDIYK